MNHMEALEIHATERYILDELSSSEKAAFEEHYFGCTICTADLESATAFVANARAVFQQKEPARHAATAPTRGWWSGWTDLMASFRPRLALAATSFATLVLGGVWLYQTVVTIPNLKNGADTAFVIPAFALAGTSRGEGTTISITPDTRSFAVSFDMDPQAGYPAYRGVLKDSAGTVRFSLQFPAPPAGQPTTIAMPAHKLQPGKYDLIVHGLRDQREASPVSVFSFTLQIQ